ncbi:response regulator transcription factor [Turicibacter sanguinis]|uniref:Response regulator n=4 Tax=Turicibacter sanguinis TaxID=154288 RepID=A0A9X5APF6_9FIRM|nr:response regulator transcription factor [Turicibacter sanguinis]EFF64136.1 response regulator receiver domain protein [Turicibacter sanguinis PC909]MCU7192019.1 response regulator transcription factor [Turicibacter sanguinis]MCU7197243.1 response regulator transcription factor [Turicibacter sanguinis]MCU7200940.1 response regulator transcription factor [Turicibacter sanguinis]MCU7211600.1 response regulator transcription factor [Turicibacter sanguinis]
MISNKILIVDDEIEIIELLETVLKHEGFSHIFHATTGTEALSLLKALNPDLVLLDVMLPDLSGHQLIKEIHQHRQIPVLFISAKTEEFDRLLGFALGADDYITKPFSAKEVAFRVKARLKTTTKTIQFGNITITDGIVSKNNEPLDLTAKEYKLLMYLVRHANKIVSKEQICHEVWGEDYFEFDNTISVHIRRLRKKIEVDPSKPKHITTIIGLGYKFVYKEDY